MENDNETEVGDDRPPCISESDVPIELDEDPNTCEMPPLPFAPFRVDCLNTNTYCRLGCICESIKSEPIVRTHCGKPSCFFECGCGNIRSRLRPRVSLLNWRFKEGDNEQEPAPVRQYDITL